MIAPSRQVTGFQDLTLRLEPGNRRQQLVATVVQPPDGLWDHLPGQFDIFLSLERWEIDEALSSAASWQAVGKVASMASSRAGNDSVIRVGEQLFSALIDRTPLNQVYRQGRAANVGTRLRLLMDHPAISAVPWELMYDPYRSDFLALSDSLPVVVRQWRRETEPASHTSAPLRVLVVSAEVVEMKAEEEIEELRRIASSSELIQVEAFADVSRERLLELIQHETFHVLHLIGTGLNTDDDEDVTNRFKQNRRLARARGFVEPEQQLVLMPATPAADGTVDILQTWDESSLVSVDSLGEALAARPDVQLVFLSGCHTHVFARELSQQVPHVLGIRDNITGDACTALTSGFYSALGQGAPLEAALTQARQMVDRTLPGSREWGLVQLFMGAEDGLRIEQSRNEEESALTPPPTRPAGQSAQDRKRWRLEQLLRVQQENLDALRRRAAGYGKNVPAFIQNQMQDIENRIEKLEQEIAELG